MKPHEKILDMIENVDPNDSDALDDIDARVWCFINNEKFIGWVNDERAYFNTDKLINRSTREKPKYTRSRDALKSIRPDGWYPILYAISNGGGCVLGFQASLFSLRAKVDSPDSYTKSLFQTEELAELHAIIQAIAWERGE